MFAIPVIGPILQMLFSTVASVFNKQQDTQQVRIQTDGKVKEASIASESLELQARTQLAIAMKDDLGSRLARDLIMFPVSMWVSLKMWYLCMHGLTPDLTWDVLDIHDNIQYIPYAIVAYLFVTTLKR